MIKKLRAFIGKTQEGYMKMKKSKVTVFIAAAVATAAFTFFGTDNIFAKSQKTQTINDGVYIGSVDVGGMTKNEAKTALSDYIESIENTTFTLQGAKGSVDATAAEMSIKADCIPGSIFFTIPQYMFPSSCSSVSSYFSISFPCSNNAIMVLLSLFFH